jgi:LacI family transcriptional regulator
VKRTTIGDVATAAGVSAATVSRVLNGGAVKEDTATRVWDAVARLDYTPNALTKSIFAGRSNTIGVIIDDLRSPFYLDLMRGIDEVADANGSLVMFANTFHRSGHEVAQVQTMDEQRVRGLVVTTGDSTDERTRRMAAGGTPCVIVARPAPEDQANLHSVALDNVAAGRLMADHVLACGHRSVAVVISGGRPSQRDRTEGLRRGLAQGGVRPAADAVISIDRDDRADAAVAALLARPEPVDVLVCLTGRRTVAVHSALIARGLSIPDDIGFVTMDDFAWAPALGITVVAQPSYRMGQKAAELIIGNPGEPARLTFRPELIARRSCGERR